MQSSLSASQYHRMHIWVEEYWLKLRLSKWFKKVTEFKCAIKTSLSEDYKISIAIWRKINASLPKPNSVQIATVMKLRQAIAYCLNLLLIKLKFLRDYWRPASPTIRIELVLYLRFDEINGFGFLFGTNYWFCVLEILNSSRWTAVCLFTISI